MKKFASTFSRTPEWKRARLNELKKLKTVIDNVDNLMANLGRDRHHKFHDIIAHFKDTIDGLKADGAELERAVANNENRTPAELRTEDVLVKRIGDAVASAEEALKRAREASEFRRNHPDVPFDPNSYLATPTNALGISLSRSSSDDGRHAAMLSNPQYQQSLAQQTSAATAQTESWEEDLGPLIRSHRRDPLFSRDINFDTYLANLDQTIIMAAMVQTLQTQTQIGVTQFVHALWNNIGAGTATPDFRLMESVLRNIGYTPGALVAVRSAVRQNVDVSHVIRSYLKFPNQQRVGAEVYSNFDPGYLAEMLEKPSVGDLLTLDAVLRKNLTATFLHPNIDISFFHKTDTNTLCALISMANQRPDGLQWMKGQITGRTRAQARAPSINSQRSGASTSSSQSSYGSQSSHGSQAPLIRPRR